MKVDVSEDWCVRMAHLEGDSEIGAGRPDLTGRLRELDKKGYQPLTGAIGEEAATVIDRLRAEVASLKEENEKLKGPRPMHESARARINDLTQQLAAANGRVERMHKTITKALNLVPANDGAGGLIYDHHSADGEYIGTEQVDPMWVIQGMCETLQAALSDLPEADKEKS